MAQLTRFALLAVMLVGAMSALGCASTGNWSCQFDNSSDTRISCTHQGGQEFSAQVGDPALPHESEEEKAPGLSGDSEFL